MTKAQEKKIAAFEEMVRKQRSDITDFSRQSDGRYADRRLNTLFSGYSMGLRAARNVGNGKYVIGKVTDGGNVPIFGEAPRVHSKMASVDSELSRLCKSAGPDTTFIVYRSVLARKAGQS